MVGQTISHYKITEKLGEGGMGVVYKAEDTTLDRTVALKFLAEHLLNDQEAKQRFLREAKAAAALDHPNICTVYQIAEAEGKTFLAMAFVQGETLEDRIAKGPLPLKDALDIGRQIAEGLEAAHRQGIVHRDIKPANILVSPEGRATIMDFGLARLTEASRLTKANQAMGTVAYMSPEQVQGMEVDHRSDIWALGCVLYEMVRGQRPFRGQYDQALAYEIVHQEPEPLTGVRAGVPMELEFIVDKCLAKDVQDRYGNANEIAKDLRSLGEKMKSGRSTIMRPATMAGTVPATVMAARTGNAAEALPPGSVIIQRKSVRVLQGVAALFAIAFLGVSAVLFIGAPLEAPETPLRRFAFTPPVAVGTSDQNDLSVAVSPDGRHIAFVERSSAGRLWVHDLDQPNPRVLEGTEGAVSPFWSPGGDFIGFAAGDEIKKVPVQGGSASRVGQLPGAHFHGPSWSPDGEVIVFGSGTGGHGLYQVPARGGTPEQVIAPNEIDPSTGEPIGTVYGAHFLPTKAGALVVVLTLHNARSGADGFASSILAVQDLETGRREFLGPGAFPSYSASGHLVYQPSQLTSHIWALPFSLKTLEATGESFPLAANSKHATVAADQTLVYLDSSETGQQQFVWLDRAGELP